MKKLFISQPMKDKTDDEILKHFIEQLNLKWYQKLYLKLLYLIKHRRRRIFISSKHYHR